MEQIKYFFYFVDEKRVKFDGDIKKEEIEKMYFIKSNVHRDCVS